MMKPLYFILALVIIPAMTSCGGEKKSSTVLDPQKFGNLIFEIGLSDAYLESYAFRDTSVRRDSAAKEELEKVLLANGISREVFRDSYEYYKANPAIFKQIVDTVYAKSQRSQEKLYGTRKGGRRTYIPDSLKARKNVFKQR
jgi:hypothetical protein